MYRKLIRFTKPIWSIGSKREIDVAGSEVYFSDHGIRFDGYEDKTILVPWHMVEEVTTYYAEES